MMLRAMNQQTTHEPANEIKALTQSIAELKEQLTNIGDKVDKLTMIVCRQMNLGQQDTVKRNGMF